MRATCPPAALHILLSPATSHHSCTESHLLLASEECLSTWKYLLCFLHINFLFLLDHSHKHPNIDLKTTTKKNPLDYNCLGLDTTPFLHPPRAVWLFRSIACSGCIHGLSFCSPRTHLNLMFLRLHQSALVTGISGFMLPDPRWGLRPHPYWLLSSHWLSWSFPPSWNTFCSPVLIILLPSWAWRLLILICWLVLCSLAFQCRNTV